MPELILPNSSATSKSLLFEDVPNVSNIYAEGQYSAELAVLSTTTVSDIAYPSDAERPPIKALTDMVERDPMVAKCVSLCALRAVQNFGNYTHPKKEIESFVNSNLNTLQKSLKRTLFKMASCDKLYGFAIAEFTTTSKQKGFLGQWRLLNINILHPERIVKFSGKLGHIEFIEYDNGNGKTVKIPYKKCIHIINNSGTSFDAVEIWGVGDGISALNYYNLKKVVLTQMALAAKNNSTGIVHAKVPNAGRTILVDSKMKPIKDSSGKPVEVTKQIALNYQLQDLYKKDYIVTDVDVMLEQLKITNDPQFWEYILSYIDKSIQMSFGVPTGIFDSGQGNFSNIGLSQNYKSVFDSNIYALVNSIKEEFINKIVKRLLYFNFPSEWFRNNLGEFVFDADDDESTKSQRLTTITSLVASGILDANDIEIAHLIRKNLGLPALDEEEKAEKEAESIQAKVQKEVEKQLALLQTQMQLQQLQNPPPPEDPEASAYPPEGA